MGEPRSGTVIQGVRFNLRTSPGRKRRSSGPGSTYLRDEELGIGPNGQFRSEQLIRSLEAENRDLRARAVNLALQVQALQEIKAPTMR